MQGILVNKDFVIGVNINGYVSYENISYKKVNEE